MSSRIKNIKYLTIIIVFLVACSFNYLGSIASAIRIDSVSPNVGPTAGNQRVTISGEFYTNVNFIEVATGDYYAISLSDEGNVYTWGGNNYGQLGNGNNISTNRPEQINIDNKKIKKVFAGDEHAVVIAEDNTLYSWGLNNFGQLGNGTTTNSNVPVKVDTSGSLSGKTIVDVAIGLYHTIALDDNGQLYSWGNNANGELGDSSYSSRSIPGYVDSSGVLNGKTIQKISCSGWSSLALGSDGVLYSWGRGTWGALGNNSTSNSNIPALVDMSGDLAAKSIVDIDFENSTAIALDNLGKIYMWGRNDDGQFGNGSTTAVNAYPVAISPFGDLASKTVIYISVGNNHTSVVTSDNIIYSWGLGSDGQLGNGTNAQSLVPIPTDTVSIADKEVVDISSNYNYSVVRLETGELYSWGANLSGQLGRGNFVSSNVPVKVISPTFIIDKLAIGGIEVNFNLIDKNTLSFLTPPHAEGYVDIKAIDSSGKEYLISKGYKYINNAIEAPNTGAK